MTEGISNMLIQSWNGIIKLFPAVPDGWKNMSFSNLLTEGSFEVSALKKNGNVTFVKISASANRRLQLKNPFKNMEFSTDGFKPEIEGNIIKYNMKQGEQVILFDGSRDEADVII